MLRSTFIALSLLTVAAMPSAVRAEHFEIQLTVSSSVDKQSSFSDTCTAQQPQGFKPRPTCRAKAGDNLVVQFFVSSNFPHEVIRHVTVRYFVVAETKAGQSAIPPRDAAVAKGEFVMDFKPNTGKVGLRQQVKISEAGTYLVRIETENSDNDHEHCSGIDVVVEGEK